MSSEVVQNAFFDSLVVDSVRVMEQMVALCDECDDPEVLSGQMEAVKLLQEATWAVMKLSDELERVSLKRKASGVPPSDDDLAYVFSLMVDTQSKGDALERCWLGTR